MTEQHEANRSRLDRHRTRRGPSTAPRITLIIVNFNGERFLPELLEGLAAQSRRDFATLLVDNGSTDGGIAL
ncbi:MAG TPA: glycosyltransferase, partial [Acidobacteriota bacterium]|nr:glycosyltransferase [Acidobacteriota bacterium]